MRVDIPKGSMVACLCEGGAETVSASGGNHNRNNST